MIFHLFDLEKLIDLHSYISYANAVNFLYMKYFCDAVRLGSITAAAKANFITQSAVTQGIGKLEDSLNCPLLARHPNRLRVTPEGQKAFLEMSDVLSKIVNIQQSFSRDYTNVVGDLEFACTHSFAMAIIPPLLKRFREEHPEAKITFYCSSNLVEIKQMLRTGEIDFGIAPNIGDLTGLDLLPIFNGTYNAYISNEIMPEEEENYGFILPDREDTTYFKEIYLNKYGKYPDIFLEAGSWEVIANLSIEGLGIGYFPDYITFKKTDFLRPCNLDLAFPQYQICALSPKGMKLRKSSNIFLSYFKSLST